MHYCVPSMQVLREEEEHLASLKIRIAELNAAAEVAATAGATSKAALRTAAAATAAQVRQLLH